MTDETNEVGPSGVAIPTTDPFGPRVFYDDANGPALALQAAKQAVNKGLEVDLATGLEIERLQFAGLFATADQKAGMRSFMENGPGKAAFEGR